MVPAWICLGMLILAQAAVTVRGALYTETFENPSTGANMQTSAIGWYAYAGNTAINYSTTTSSGSSPFHDYAAVSTTDFLFVNNAVTLNQTFAVVHEFGTGLTINSGDTFSWQMGNATTAATAQIMIQVGSSWYVSTSVKQNTKVNGYGSGTDFINAVNASSADVSFSLAFDPSTTGWKTVTLTDGVELSIGSTITNPFSSTTTITGVGFYLVDAGASISQSMRIDTLQIVPEPNALALIGLGGILLVFGARRSRR